MASGVAAAGAAAAFYLYSRKVKVCGFGGRGDDMEALEPISTHFEGAYQAPSNWVEALFFFAESLRYMYGETLGRWRTADLLIGLAYLARRETARHPMADIAETGDLAGQNLDRRKRRALVVELRRMAHFMKYCQALRERRMPAQVVVLSRLGIAPQDILLQQGFAGMLKPSYVLVKDHRMRCVVLAIRGTHSMKDMFTSLTGASKPHHMVSGSGVVLGYSHFGMLAAARWVLQQVEEKLRETLASCPGYHLQIVGHSLGAGTAALLTTRLREMGGEFTGATCLAIACPACLTEELAQQCAGYVTTIINGHDIIPTLSPGAADVLREEVMESAWYEAFRQDMRSSVVVRAVEASLGSVGSVTSAATSWTSTRLASASRSLRACYSQRSKLQQGSLKRSSSDPDMSTRDDESLAAGRIQIAREWAIPQEDGNESPGWSRVLASLEPLEQDMRPSISGRPADEPLRSSWPTPSKQAPPAVASSSKSLTKRAGELWSKVWLQGCRVDNDGTSLDGRLDSRTYLAEASMPFDDADQPMSPPKLYMVRSGSLPAVDLLAEGDSFREVLRETKAAAQLQSGASQQSGEEGDDPDDPPMSPTTSPEREQERRRRRLMFPAGKVMHLVPARLVFGEAAPLQEEQSGSPGCSPGSDRVEGSSESELWRHASAKLDDSGVEELPSSGLYEGVLGHESPEEATDPYVIITTNGGRNGSRGLAPPIPPPEDFVLLENVPREVYGRIRLCSRMLADHFIPSYLGSLETALKYIENGYPPRILPPVHAAEE